MSKTIIDIKDVTYLYKGEDEGSRKGVREVNLTIDEGEFIVFLGHNGSGKSTLAKLLNGFLIPDEGTVTVNGMVTGDEEKCYDIRSTVGMVFQNPDNQTVASIIEDDVAFGPENLGVEPAEIRRRVDWALTTVGMYDYKDRTPHRLSGGQKQRVAIASILAMLPSVLILDESTAMLDPEGRIEVLNTVKKLNREKNMTVILITHYMDEALDADRIFVLSEGRIIKNGTPKEIFSDPVCVSRAKLEFPIATSVAFSLREQGYDLAPGLTDEELVEGVCRLL